VFVAVYVSIQRKSKTTVKLCTEKSLEKYISYAATRRLYEDCFYGGIISPISRVSLYLSLSVSLS